MDRKDFLRTCAAGLCACTAGLSAAETPNPDDWRIHFGQQRYAGLLRILSTRLGEKGTDEVLHDLGSVCSSLWDQVEKHKGDIEGFCKAMNESPSGDRVSWDSEKRIVSVTSLERTDCFCPLISVRHSTPPVACNCSLGWHQHTWETVLQKKVQVELKESVLRGGKRCVFEVKVLG